MRRLLSAFVIFTAVTVAACSDDDGTGIEASVEGTYNLVTYGGKPLPAIFEQQGVRLEYLSSVLVLRPDQTFDVTEKFKLMQGTDTTSEQFSVNGTWSRSGSTLTFSVTQNGQTETSRGEWNGIDTISFTDAEGVVGIYRK